MSKGYVYRLKSDIRRKLRILTDLELPLLIKAGYILEGYNLTTNGKDLTANCKIEPQSHLSYMTLWGDHGRARRLARIGC